MGLYTVQEGDTLSAISERITGKPTAWRTIADANGLADPNALSVGQTLEIDGYEPEEAEGIPTPRMRPNPHGVVAGRPDVPVGSMPAAEEPITRIEERSPRAAGAEDIFAEEEMAIPEDPTYGDLTAEMTDRFGEIQQGGIAAEDQDLINTTAPSEAAPEDPMLQRGVSRPTEQADPDFSQAEAGPSIEITRDMVMSLQPEDRQQLVRILKMLESGGTAQAQE